MTVLLSGIKKGAATAVATVAENSCKASRSSFTVKGNTQTAVEALRSLGWGVCLSVCI